MSDNTVYGFFDRCQAAWLRTWKRRWLVVGVAWSVGLAGALLIPLLPQRYEASARVYVDTQSVLKPLMDGLAYQPDIDQQVRMLARTVMARPNLERLLQQADLGLPVATVDERETTLTRLMNRIKLAPTDTGLYLISYRDAQPARAQRVVEATVDLFMHSSAGDQLRDSENARRFIDEQIASYDAKLSDAEARLKQFKMRNFGVSGVSNQDYFVRMSSLADALDHLHADLFAAEQARDSYRRELAGEQPQLPRLAGRDEGAPLSGLDALLNDQRRRPAELSLRFTEQHPDVMGLRKQIAQLESQQRAEAEEAAKTGGTLTVMAATSPIYQRLRVALAESEALVASLRSRVAGEQRRLDDVRALASRIPQVEAELAQLNRDYDVMRKNYDQLVARRESASLGVKLDESSRLRDFRVVDPPRVADAPVAPSRLALARFVIVLSLIAGLLAPSLLDRLRPTFDDARSLREWLARPVLGSIPLSLGPAALRRHRHAEVGLMLAALALWVLQGCWLAWMAGASLMGPA